MTDDGTVIVGARGLIGSALTRALIDAGNPVIGIDSVRMRREASLAAGAALALDPGAADFRNRLDTFLGGRRVVRSSPKFIRPAARAQ